MQFARLGGALQGDFLAPVLHRGQQFWQDFVPVVPAA